MADTKRVGLLAKQALRLQKLYPYNLPKQNLKYHPTGRKWLRCPLKRLLDDINAETTTDQPRVKFHDRI